MEAHERNLFITLCLGLHLKGNESSTQLHELLEEVSAVSDSNEVRPLQDDLADWLDTSIARCKSQQEASVRLWSKIDEKGYSLVDVPMKLRRRAFGGSTEIQKRHAGNTGLRKLLRSIIAGIIRITILAGLATAAWFAWKRFGQ